MADPARLLTFRILTKWQRSDRYIDRILQYELNRSSLESQGRNWVTEVVLGTTRHQLHLDFLIQRVFKGNYKKAQMEIKSLLRMGCYQLRFMETPTYAAVNEMVALTKVVKLTKASGLVNAVLRKVAALDLGQALDDAGVQGTRRLSIEMSHPEWLLDRWIQRLDEAAVRARCDYNNTAPKSWIRYNALKVDRETWESFLSDLGMAWQRHQQFPDFYEVAHAGALFQSKANHDGWFTVQDVAAGLAPRVLAPQSNDTVLDLCAAPGGKSTYLVELAGGEAQVIAYDTAQVRLEQMELNFKRLGHPGLEAVAGDVTKIPLPKADKILLDVPCSGTGVLNRRADLRWHRRPEDIQDLVDIQRQMLENAWRSLKPGGTLVYSTCTLEPEENWEQIRSFLEREPSADIEPSNDEQLQPFIDKNGAIVTLPERDRMDGMYVVRLRKQI
ncbi:MAG: 16S rRNA (cytosine(967)-C(5))-methyltransferase RsmB [Candidatus Marinimicrobia bacterium]|nr:16S rRNA (cytosine(967)-C(5))-methyltransferase RsmB [Candidatus Neomarinimicrobiota bacterium]MCF7840138.1 16S rRNA (cytosine(967)-C(5))-methyltransferase RsmB [Candidatus Neomarinimicrobiota bacterium]